MCHQESNNQSIYNRDPVEVSVCECRLHQERLIDWLKHQSTHMSSLLVMTAVHLISLQSVDSVVVRYNQ